MSSSSDQRTHLKLLNVGDFDPQTAVNIDITGRVFAEVVGQPHEPLHRRGPQNTPVAAPGESMSFTHVFQRRVTPP